MIGTIFVIILFISYITSVSLCLALEIRDMIKRDKELKKIRDKYNK